MSIAVTCPKCSAKFKAKDEYAGKRAKCPKCGEPLTIPSASGPEDTVKVPPPAAKTTPKAVARPQPMDDEGEDDRPKPKRRRDDDEDADENPRAKRPRDEDEDEKPKAKRPRDEDAEEESPRSKRRRDDEEDAPKKRRGGDDDDKPRSRRRRRDDNDDTPTKKSALPLILGILGGVLLLCGGGCAGVWFGMIVPAAEKQRQLNDAKQAELDRLQKEFNNPQPNGAPNPNAPGDRKYTQDDMNKVRAGMTLAQVEELLGKSRLPDDFDMLRAFNGPESEKAWANKRKEKCVLVWGNLSNVVLVAFTTPPANGGTVIGVLGVFGVERIEPIKLLGGGDTATPPVPAGGGSLGKALPVMTPDEAVRDAKKNNGNFVIVTGTAAADLAIGAKGSDFAFTHMNGKPLRFSTWLEKLPVAIRKGQTVELMGKIDYNNTRDTTLLDRVVLLSPAAELKVSDLVAAYQKDLKAAAAQYSSSTYKFTARVRSADFGNVVLDDGGAVKVTPSFLNSEDLLRIKKGDTITFFGNPGALFNDPKLGSVLVINDCQLPPAKSK